MSKKFECCRNINDCGRCLYRNTLNHFCNLEKRSVSYNIHIRGYIITLYGTHNHNKSKNMIIFSKTCLESSLYEILINIVE